MAPLFFAQCRRKRFMNGGLSLFFFFLCYQGGSLGSPDSDSGTNHLCIKSLFVRLFARYRGFI